jgi:hypothetical protein
MTSSTGGADIMTWFIHADSTQYALKVTGGTPYTKYQPPEGTLLPPQLKDDVPAYGYVDFDTLDVDIYPTDKYGKVIGKVVISLTIEMKDKKPIPNKPDILTFTDRGTTPEGHHSYVITAPKLPIPREKPPVISNRWWMSGQSEGDPLNVVKGERFWVTDYGQENGEKKWSFVNPGMADGIQQSTDGPPWGSRAYPINIKTEEPDWKKPGPHPVYWQVSGGYGVAFEGCWQIAIKVGSNGLWPWCETFYLAERILDGKNSNDPKHDLVWGPEYYSDGQGGIGDLKSLADLKANKKVPLAQDKTKDQNGYLVYGKKTERWGAYSREIDIMETRWNPDGPQFNLGNMGGGTAWNQEAAAPNYGIKKPLWTDVAQPKKDPAHPNAKLPLTADFIIFGCFIRLKPEPLLWLYAYKGETDKNVPWYCTEAIKKTNTLYDQKYPFVPYIGTWSDWTDNHGHNVPEVAPNPKWWTQYNRFRYRPINHSPIKGKNPREHPEVFGWPLTWDHGPPYE